MHNANKYHRRWENNEIATAEADEDRQHHHCVIKTAIKKIIFNFFHICKSVAVHSRN